MTMITKPCSDCGEPHTLDDTRYATAAHDCDSGTWFELPWPTDLPDHSHANDLLAPGAGDAEAAERDG